MNILFVCTGNTCRSPMAEALFRERVRRAGQTGEIDVRSAGLLTTFSFSLSRHAQTVLRELGLPTNHKPRQLNSDWVEWADWILTMTQRHKRTVIKRFPSSINQTLTLHEFVNPQNLSDIVDPIGRSLTTYRLCAETIDRALVQLLPALKS